MLVCLQRTSTSNPPEKWLQALLKPLNEVILKVPTAIAARHQRTEDLISLQQSFVSVRDED